MAYPQNKKVLIIDDESDLCLLLKEYFHRKGNEVLIAHTLKEGRKLMQDILPDIVFLDNNLPDGPGWEIAKYIVTDFPSVLLVLISSFSQSVADMPEGAKYVAIEKPIRITDLDKLFMTMSSSPS